jgi:alpha-tubulin suppressor-like RCC1 family protein
VVLKDGTVWGWGANEHGQLGDCTTLLAPTRRKTFALDTVVQVEAAGWHSLALCEDGTLWSWGLNDAGQLGLGDYTDRHVPTKIGSPLGLGVKSSVRERDRDVAAAQVDGRDEGVG